MRRLFLIVFALLALLLAAAVIAPTFLPSETYRGRIETALSERLDRQVQITGDVQVRLLPSLAVSAADVRIANAPGYGDEPFAEMAALRLRLALIPLLSRQVIVEEFVLVDPVIRMASDGRTNNWSFGSGEAGASGGQAQGRAQGRRPGALPFDAELGDVRIENGRIVYRAPDADWRINEADLAAVMSGLDDPARISGRFILNEEAVRLDLEAGSLRALFEGAETPLTLNLGGEALTLDFDGLVPAGADYAIAGRAELDMDLRRMARLAGAASPEGDAFRRFSGSGQLTANAARAAFTGAQVRLDDIAASGRVDAVYSGARPQINAELAVPELDLTPYIPAEDGARGAAAGGGLGPWSEAPLELGALRGLDASLNAEVGRLIARDIELTDAVLEARLNNGLLTADIERFRLYDGDGFAQARIDLRGGVPQMRLAGRLDALQAQPFLAALAEFNRLQGVSGLEFEFTASGASPAAIMSSLNGTGCFGVENGALVGVNLAQVIRTVEQAIETRALPSGFGDRQTTDFTSLAGSFTVQNGRARNIDLAMLSPLLRVAGEGEINLAEQTIAYRLTPRAVQSLTGQGGQTDLAGIAVPIRISGSFSDLSIGLDYEAIIQSLLRAQAADAIGGDVGRALSDGETLEDAARDAVGALVRDAINRNVREDAEQPADGEPTQGETPAAEPRRDPGRALFEGLLNQALGGQDEEDPPAQDTPSEDPPGR